MATVKPETYADAYWFLAQHPLGLQNMWLDYFKQRVFKYKRGHPNYGPDTVETQAVVELQDRDRKYEKMEHTKFRFHPINNLQQQAAVLHEIQHHPLTESLQVVIFEEKFDDDLFEGIIVADMKDWIRKIFFDRLVKTVNFVDEVQKAMELYTAFNKSVKYDPLRVICSLTIELDNREFPQWLPSMLQWQTAEGEVMLPRGEVTNSLAHALTEIAWNTGYPEWVVGQRELINNQRNADDSVVHLKCHFSTRRMALGLEVISDEEFHPYLDYTLCHKSASLCAYVALIMDPKPGNLVLDLSMNIQDYMMAIFHNYDYLTYISAVNNRTHYNDSKLNSLLMEGFCYEFMGKCTNRHDFIHLRHWSHIEHQDILLSQVDRLILPIPYLERPYTRDLDELLICIKIDYDFVLKIAEKMSLGSRIMLIFNRIDADYVYQIMTPDIACLQITWAKTIFDREEYLIIMEVERVPAPAPPSPLIDRLEQASLRLQDLALAQSIKMEEEIPTIPLIPLEARKMMIPPPKPLKPAILPGKTIIPPKPKKTPVKLHRVRQKTPEFIRRKKIKRPWDSTKPGGRKEPITPLDEVVIPIFNSPMAPMEPLLRAMAIMSARQAAERGEKPLGQRIPKVEESSRDDSPQRPPPPPPPQPFGPSTRLESFLKTPVKYPVKLKKSPRIQKEQRTPQKVQKTLQKPQFTSGFELVLPQKSPNVQKPPIVQKPSSGPAKKLPTGLFSTKVPVERPQPKPRPPPYPYPVPNLPPVSRIPPPGLLQNQRTPQKVAPLPSSKKPPAEQLFTTKVPVTRVLPPQAYSGPLLPPVPREPPTDGRLFTPGKRPPPMLKSPPRERRSSGRGERRVETRAEPPKTRTQAAKSGEAKEKTKETTLKSPTRIQPIRSPRQQAKDTETSNTKGQASTTRGQPGPSAPSRGTGPSPGPASRTRTADSTAPGASKAKESKAKAQNPGSGILSPGRGRKAEKVEKSGTISAITSPGRTRASTAAITAASVAASIPTGSKTKTPAKAQETVTKTKKEEKEMLKTPKPPAIRHSPRTHQKRSSKRIAAKEKEEGKKKKK